MPVYKYGIAMFYIYLYMSISIYIYTAILWKETRKKDQTSQEIGLFGALRNQAQKEGIRDSISI